jgi:hypothetical protein
MDIGYDIPLPFETFDKWIVCICATNMCNTNLNSCRSSVTIQIQSNSFPSVLPWIVPQLTTSISCFSTTTPSSNWLNLSSYCSSSQSAYINLTECNQHVINNIVLCLIIVSGSDVVPMALTKDKYESTLLAYIETIYYLSQDWIIGQFSNWSWSYLSINWNLTNLYDTIFINLRCFCGENNCNSNLICCLNFNQSLSIVNNVTSKLYSFEICFFIFEFVFFRKSDECFDLFLYLSSSEIVNEFDLKNVCQ